MAALSEVLLLSEVWAYSQAQMRGTEPHFPLSQGIPRVDDPADRERHHLRIQERAALA